MQFEWVDLHAGFYQFKVNGTVEGMLNMSGRNFLYYPNFGYAEHNAPFPEDLDISLDDLKAWAIAIYRMGG